uniref:Uncharacterized protein n=1 Tax=Romanomermis culicivorax TaxID=13658 RepID=A0A915HQ36_ROMCU
MRQTLPALLKDTSAQGYGLPKSDSNTAAVVSALTPLSALPPPPPKYATLVNVNPPTMPKMTGDISVIASYGPMEGTPAPLVGVLSAANVVLSEPAVLQILGPNIARRALQFIADGTIHATLVDKILLDGELSSLAVDAVRHAVEQASRNTQLTAVVAASLSTMRTGAQTLATIAQQQPVAAAKLPPPVANAFGETLRAVNDDVSIIEASPFPTATPPGPQRLAFFAKSTHVGVWSSTSRARSQYRPPTRTKNETARLVNTVHIDFTNQSTNGNSTHHYTDQLASATPPITNHTDQLTSATPRIIDATSQLTGVSVTLVLVSLSEKRNALCLSLSSMDATS